MGGAGRRRSERTRPDLLGHGVSSTAGSLPPGQAVARGWPVLHYGPVPRFRPDAWDLRVCGATASGEETCWTYPELSRLPRTAMTADLHCVTKFTVRGARWEGIPAAALLQAAPPDPGVTHVMVWAEYGYGANLRLDDLVAPTTLFADRCGGEALPSERGHPLRLVVPHLYAWKGPKWVRAVEYLLEDRRGFWEERGYHNVGDPWREQRYAYQEDAGDGPPL